MNNCYATIDSSPKCLNRSEHEYNNQIMGSCPNLKDMDLKKIISPFIQKIEEKDKMISNLKDMCIKFQEELIVSQQRTLAVQTFELRQRATKPTKKLKFFNRLKSKLQQRCKKERQLRVFDDFASRCLSIQ